MDHGKSGNLPLARRLMCALFSFVLAFSMVPAAPAAAYAADATALAAASPENAMGGG